MSETGATVSPQPRRAARADASDGSGTQTARSPAALASWRSPALWGCLLAAVLELAFVGKPFHIDDYLFVRVARSVLRHPLAPYTGPDFFTGGVRDLFVHNNPPLVPAVLAATIARFGEAVVALHLSLLPFTLLAAAAFARIAAEVCRRPLTPTLLWASGVPLILSGSHLMSDAPAVALALAGLALALCSARGGRQTLLWIPAGLILGLAPVAKYSMGFFLLYVPAFAWSRGLARSRALGLAFLAALPSAAWAAHNLWVYGAVHAIASGRQGADSPLGLEWMAWWWVRQKAMATVAAVGQVGVSPLLVVLLAVRWRPRWQLLLPLAAALWFCTQLPGYSTGQLLQFGVWTGLGWAALLCWLRRPAAPASWLALWLVALLVLTVLIFPFAAVRFVLPCVPALLLLLWRTAEDLGLSRAAAAACVVLQIAFTAAVGAADDQYARLYGPLAEKAAQFARDRHVPLWFAAEGALRPELEKHGARYLTSRVDQLPRGSLIAIGVNCHHYGLSPRLSTVLYEDTVLDAAIPLPLRLESSEERAGFYAHPNGYLPVAFSAGVAESVYLFRVDAPNPFAQYFLEHRDVVAVQGEVIENVHQFKRGFWPSFRAHPPSIARFELDAPPGASVRFGFGIREEVSGPSFGDGVTFRVRGRLLGRPGSERLLFERYIDPKNRPEERHIHQAEAPLGDLAGGRVQLDFENDCGPVSDCRYDWALWTMPELLSAAAR
jgi:hypothetical protein